jgi:hypothetical protein
MRPIKSIMVVFAAFSILAGLWLACSSNSQAKPSSQDMIKRGEFLVKAGGCNDCHTPFIMTAQGPQHDPNAFLAGHPQGVPAPDYPKEFLSSGKWSGAFTPEFTAWAGPWGISFSANITPDQTTGIGAWNEEVFIKALRTGKHMGAGRPILPPMPWQNFSFLTDDDLRAIFAYLKTVPPVYNQVPPPVPPPAMANATP